MQIKGKLLLFSLCISLIPIAIITTLAYFNARQTLKRQVLKELTAIAGAKRLHLLNLLKEKQVRTEDFSSDGFIKDSLEEMRNTEFRKQDTVATLSKHLSQNKKPLDLSIIAIAVADLEGNIVASTNETMTGLNVSDQDAFVRGSSDTHIDKPRRFPHLNAKGIRISAPIFSKADEQLLGVIINYYDLAMLNDVTASRVGMGETGEVMLGMKDDSNVVFLNPLRYAPEAALELSIPLGGPVAEPMKLALSGGSEIFLSNDYRNALVLAAYEYIPETGWGLVAKIDKEEAFASLKMLNIAALTVGLVAAAAVAGLGIVFAVSTSRPIKQLTNATNRLAGGDLEYRTNISRHDEIGTLAKGFNTMADELAKEITGHKVAEEKLRGVVTDLERSNAELQQFAYVASHDLQEPLRMVASYTQLLARRYKGRLDADADEFIAFAVDGANRMQMLINDLLQYSRVGTRGKPFEPTDTKTVLDQTVSNLDVAIKESGAVLTHDTLPTVMADATQLTQVFQNLIGNAIKFRSKETPRIHVSAKEKENEWVFSVRDNGIGIDPQYFDRIFVIFQRLHGKTEYPGTGIGLAVCKRIVERHGGRIWIESEEGKGSTFYFTIPKR